MENLEIKDETDNERIERVRNAIASRASSIREVMWETRLHDSVLYRLEREGKIKLPRGKRGRPKKINETALNEALEKGENSLEKLCRIGGFKSPHSMWTHCTKHNLPWPENPIPYITWPEVDILIEQGLLTETEIGKKVNRSKELIRQYINASGQYDYWRGKRETIEQSKKEEKEDKDKLRQRFLFAVRTRTEELAKKEGWATQKAVEYLHSYKVRSEQNYSFDILYSVFKKYEEALKKGKKISLRELGREYDLYSNCVSNILAGVGLEPIHGKNIKARKDKIDAVKRGFNLNLSSADVGYFLEHPENNVRGIFSYIGRRGKTHLEIGRLGKKEYLTYRLASQIYEAQDAGFNEDETAELLDTNYDLVEYAISCRDEGIEKKLINDLRILFNDKTIKTPYVTRDIREKLGQDIVN